MSSMRRVETMGSQNQRRQGGPQLRRGVLASLLVVLVFVVFASVAVAGSGTSASDQYDHAKAIKPAATDPTSAATPTKGHLPFTGLSLLSVVVVGGTLVGVGVALRRRNERDES